MANSGIVITNVVIWIFSNIVLVPIEAYYCYQIYYFSDSLVVAKRKPGILLLSVISSMVFYFLWQTILLILSPLGFTVLRDIHLYTSLYYIILPVWYISWFTFIVRLWILYFTIRHSIATINNQWQEVVCKQAKETNYYLQYKQQLGTLPGLIKKILIYSACTYLIDLVMGILVLYFNDTAAKFAIYGTLGVVKALTSTLIPMGFLIYMAYQLTQLTFHDNIGLGREIKLCTCGYVLILVIRLVDYSISAAAEKNVDKYEVIVSYIVAIEFLLWKLVGFTINLLQTKYPLRRFARVMQRYSTRQIGKLTHATTLKNVGSSDQATLNEGLKMKEVLNNEKSFDLFMAHCGSEHATECVLSMIEFTQFKQEIYKVLSNNGRTDLVNPNTLLHDSFTLPQNCPQSDVVFSTNKNFKAVAYALYEKYIAVGCDWEINLDYFTRRKYNRLFENEETWDTNKEYDDNVKLYEIFDKCLVEMTQLVSAAFSRFKQTDSFMILQNKTKSIKRFSSNYEDEEDLY